MKNTKKWKGKEMLGDTFGNAFIKFCESQGIKFIDTPVGKVGVDDGGKIDIKQFKKK